MKIKHRRGKFNNRFHNDMRLYFLFTLYRFFRWLRLGTMVEVTLIFDADSTYFMGKDNKNQQDWRKAFGSKSGGNTATNNEEMAAYRFWPAEGNKPYYLLGTFEACRYNRDPTVSNRHLASKHQSVELYMNRDAELKVLIEPKYRWPVTPWAGGNELPHCNFTFEMRTRFLFTFIERRKQKRKEKLHEKEIAGFLAVEV